MLKFRKMFLGLILSAFLLAGCSTVHQGNITEKVRVKQSALQQQPVVIAGIKYEVLWQWEQWRDGICIDTWEYHNTVMNEGLNHILDVEFHGEAASGTWYVLIFEDDITPSTSTTYAAPIFTESTAYTEGTRPAYVEAAASSQTITNSANKAVFSINATKTMYGAALVDDSTKDDQVAAGAVMFCAAKFGSSKSVENGDTLKVTIAISMANS